MDRGLQTATRVLQWAIGLMAALAGLDKFFNILADWGRYVSPAAAAVLPVSTDVFMRVAGIVELAVGLAILTVLPRAGAYAASAWLLIVAVNLVLGGHLDVAVRDVVLAVAAFTLARLIEVRGTASHSSR